jgi:hypothetical protein
LRRISVVVVLGVLMLILASPIALAEKPSNPNGFGTVVSQKATTYHDVGKHSSSQEEPRQGVGNVARNDPAPRDHPGDHGCFIGEADGDPNTDCNKKPGR